MGPVAVLAALGDKILGWMDHLSDLVGLFLYSYSRIFRFSSPTPIIIISDAIMVHFFNLWISVGIVKIEFMSRVSVHTVVLCVVFVTGFQSP